MKRVRQVHGTSARRASVRRCLALAAGSLVAVLISGCSALSTTGLVRVVPSAPPERAGIVLPSLAEDDPRRPLILSESARFADPATLNFLAAREAFWDYDTDTAVKLLRELRQADGISADHFQALVLQCFDQSERWAETLPLYREFGLEEKWSVALKHARFMASLPPRAFEFAPNPPAIPIDVEGGGWIAANGAINGTPARFGLDTGAGLSWVSERFARRAGLEILPHSISLYDANDRARDAPLAIIRELRLGGVTVRNLPVVIGRSFLANVMVGVDMILGWEILQQLDVTWDFPARHMTIAAPNGPVSAEPNLSGRVAPILTVLSSAGRPIELFLDTGAHANRRTCMTLFDNEGVLATKLPIGDFRPSLLPTVGAGLHSISASWPRRAQPFRFWMGGYRFELTSAALAADVHEREHLVFADGVVGNAPFMGGRLRICGVRRELTYEPATAGAMPALAHGQIAATADPSRRRRPVTRPVEPSNLVELTSTSADRVFLSDAVWTEARVGWGRPMRNRFWVEDHLATSLALLGEVFDRGLYAHASSRYVFPLGGKWRTLSATVGIRDGADQQGSAVFTISGDGRELHRSPLLRAGARADIRVDVSGVQQLELIVDGGEGHPHNSWAIWVDPRVER